MAQNYKRIMIATCVLLCAAVSAFGAEVKSSYAKFGDIKVHYQSSGKGDKALIFVHGWTCNADFWRPQMEAFTSVRVIAIDLPGHGLSDKPHVDYTMAYFARSIEAVMRDAGVKRAVLVGHSMGAPVIREFYRSYRDKTIALVLVDGSLRLFFSRAQMDQLLNQFRANYSKASAQMVDGIMTGIKDENLKKEIRTVMLSAPDYVAVSAMEGMADEKNYKPDPIMVPVLAVLAKSPFWPPDTETFFRSLAPELEYHMWDGVSHFLMMEKPQEFNETLLAFITRHSLLKLPK
jgi:pimeloyl-ACP methyl ester carboxylesterase